MTIELALLASLAPPPYQIDLDGSSALTEILERHADITDVTFVFEGTEEYVGPPIDGAPSPVRFQGTYRYRNDGAAELDIYVRGRPLEEPLVRMRLATIGGRFRQLHMTPDLARQGANPDIYEAKGTIRSFGRVSSFNRILFLGFFKLLAERPNASIQVEGMDEVEGYQCLKMTIDEAPDSPVTSRWVTRYWIDLARGGHPLRVETTERGRLLSRIHGINLRAFTVESGGKVWLPVAGVSESYRWEDEYSDTPFVRESYSSVPSSVVLNQGLPDGLFGANWDLAYSAAGLEGERGDFAAAVAAPAPPPAFRTDPEGVREDLDRRLAEADEQAAMLEASSATRGGGWRMPLVQGLLVIGGAVAIGFALLRRAGGR